MLTLPLSRAAETTAPVTVIRRRHVVAFGSVCLLLVLATGWSYLPVRQHEFVAYDDPPYVSENPMVQAGLTWPGVKWAFTTGHAGNWHPLTWLSHQLDVQLFGPGPAGPHVVNLLLHLANTVLLFTLMRRLTGAFWRSAFVAGFFALHPLHVESVAWIAERKDVLSGFFFLLTLWAYVKSTASSARRGAWNGCALLFFAAGLMSKPMLVTLPFVLLLLDFWPLQRGKLDGSSWLTFWQRLVFEKLPFFGLAAISCLITFFVQRGEGAVLSLSRFPLGERVANAFVSYGRYLGKTFWPADLAVFYPHPGRWPAGSILAGVVLVIGLGVVAIWLRRRLPFLALGVFWFLGMLIPTIGLVQVGSQSIADRYTYLPMIGLLIAIAWAGGELVARWPGWRVPVVATTLLGLGVCLALTRIQVGHWRDTETLFQHAVVATERNGLAHDKLGIVAMARGNLDEAIGHFRRACDFQPSFPEFHNNLGNALWKSGRTEDALTAYRRALEIAPHLATAHENLGIVLFDRGDAEQARRHFEEALKLQPRLVKARNNLGSILLERGQFDEALVHIAQVLQANPDDAPARNNAGNVALVKGDVAGARVHFEAVLRAQPNSAPARANLGRVFLAEGRVEEAAAAFEHALVAQPDFADAHYHLGTILLGQGRLDDAIARFQKLLSIQPGLAQVHNDLGVAFIQQGRGAEALAHFRKAAELAPDFAAAHNNVGKVLLQMGGVREAVEHFQTALRLQPDDPDTLSNLAWVFAAAPEPSLRSGMQAIVFAQRANQRERRDDPLILRSLAAAFAESGRFAEATATAKRAIAIAGQQGNGGLGDALRSDLQHYQNGSPVRDAALAEASK